MRGERLGVFLVRGSLNPRNVFRVQTGSREGEEGEAAALAVADAHGLDRESEPSPAGSARFLDSLPRRGRGVREVAEPQVSGRVLTQGSAAVAVLRVQLGAAVLERVVERRG